VDQNTLLRTTSLIYAFSSRKWMGHKTMKKQLKNSIKALVYIAFAYWIALICLCFPALSTSFSTWYSVFLLFGDRAISCPNWGGEN